MPFLLGIQFKVLSLPALTIRPRRERPSIYSGTVEASRINVYSPGISNEDQSWPLQTASVVWVFSTAWKMTAKRLQSTEVTNFKLNSPSSHCKSPIRQIRLALLPLRNNFFSTAHWQECHPFHWASKGFFANRQQRNTVVSRHFADFCQKGFKCLIQTIRNRDSVFQLGAISVGVLCLNGVLLTAPWYLLKQRLTRYLLR